jgi:hypothetical protein
MSASLPKRSIEDPSADARANGGLETAGGSHTSVFNHQPIGDLLMKIISDQKLAELLAASPAERVTPEYIKSRIAVTIISLAEG